MDSFTVNKLAGSFLGAAFFMMTLGIVSNALFHSETPEEPGFAIAAAEGGAATEAQADTAAEIPAIVPLLASADAAKGEVVFKKCAACHDDSKGGPNKVGPNLYGVVGRNIAAHEGFSYSTAMKDFSEGGAKAWDFETLNHFIHGPKKLVSGTAMGFAGLKKPEDIANLLVYLNNLSDNPLPLQ